MRLSHHDIAVVLKDLAFADDGDEVLCAPDLALQAFPDLLAGENRRCAGRVDRLGIGDVDGDHDGSLIPNDLRKTFAERSKKLTRVRSDLSVVELAINDLEQ